jgi:4-amino-4-deoxy-L-arabinose transferase-like glycosyltransferase
VAAIGVARRWGGAALVWPRLSEGALVGGLVLLAVALRLPYLWDVPRFTDETDEVLLGLQIARGQRLPLVNQEAYIGPFWNYLLAGVFLVTGPSLFVPRMVALVFGALTVVPSYLLARELAGRSVATLAALLLVASPAHIAVNSHIAWSHCITPLFTTIGFWLLVRAVGSGRWLLPAGLAFGVAAQTHPTVVGLLPGALGYVLWKRPGLLRSPWLWFGAVAFAVATVNLIVYNAANGWVGLTTALDLDEAELRGGSLVGSERYLYQLDQLAKTLPMALGGRLSEDLEPFTTLLHPSILVFVALTATGLVLLVRRGEPLAALLLIPLIILMPAIHGRLAPAVPKLRYLAPLLPLCYTACALAAVELARWGLRAMERRPGLGELVRPVVYASLALLVVGPLILLAEYYVAAERAGRTNAVTFETAAVLQAAHQPGDVVLIDSALRDEYTLSGGREIKYLRLIASIPGWSWRVVDAPKADLLAGSGRGGRLLVVHRLNERQVAARYRLQRVSGASISEAPYTVYRVHGRS